MLPTALSVRRHDWKFGALLVLATVTSAYSVWRFAWPIFRRSEVADHVGHFGVLYVHVIGGTSMLGVGAAALLVGWTRWQFRWHRVLGYVYLGGGAAGAALGVMLAFANVHGGSVAPLALDLRGTGEIGWALATQGMAWLLASGMAYRAARNRRLDAHRQWMVRSYVVAWGFALGVLADHVPGLSDLGDGAAIRWLAWVAALLVAEVALQWRETGPRSAARDARPSRQESDT